MTEIMPFPENNSILFYWTAPHRNACERCFRLSKCGTPGPGHGQGNPGVTASVDRFSVTGP